MALEINNTTVNKAEYGDNSLAKINYGKVKIWPNASSGHGMSECLIFESPSLCSIGMATSATAEYCYDDSDWETLDGTEVQFGGDKGPLYVRAASPSAFKSTSTGRFSVRGKLDALAMWKNEDGTATEEYSWKELFKDCTNLEDASGLVFCPATYCISCYESMFDGCTALKKVPALPSKLLAPSSYKYMFRGCTAIENAPHLPATGVTDHEYYGMFQNCTALKTASNMSAEFVSDEACAHMYDGCSELSTVPDMKTSSVKDGGMAYMFYNCRKIWTGPKLPAKIIGDHAYDHMFYGCESLREMPGFDIYDCGEFSYCSMFQNCPYFRDVPNDGTIGGKKVGEGAYMNMYNGCKFIMLITIIEPSDGHIPPDCYKGMFLGNKYLRGIRLEFHYVPYQAFGKWFEGTSHGAFWHSRTSGLYKCDQYVVNDGFNVPYDWDEGIFDM